MRPTVVMRRSTTILIAVIAILIGVGIGFGIVAWAGPPIATKSVPMFIARANGQAVPGTFDGSGFAATLKPDLAAVVNISSSRVVKPQANQLEPFFNNPFFQQFFGGQMPQPQPQRELSLGSGVIVSPDGYIITNNHVIDKATDIKVFLPNKQQYKGKVIGADPKTDIAVVKIDAINLPTITLGDSSKLQVGDLAFAIGDPFGIGETATMGIISATGRNGLDIEDYEDFIQTDASINPGNSGGALVNAHGQLIGINTAILAGQSGGNQGIGFAIPINMARYVMDQIIRHGKVIRGYMGVLIQDVTPALSKAFNVPEGKGALISQVESAGPGAKAGLERGDVIESLNGQAVSGANEIKLRIGQMAPGTVAHLKILRNGQQKNVDVRLAESPQKAAQASAASAPQATPLRGVHVQDLTPDIAQQLGLRSGTKGVVVTNVDSNAPAYDAGLRRGDVIEEINRKPVGNVSEYDQMASQVGKQAVVLLVNRGGNTLFLVVEPE